MTPGNFLGILSDTHGILRVESCNALAGASMILHAGDVGKPGVLAELQKIAPIIAVRGNVDRGEWANTLPISAVVEWEGRSVFVLHDLKELDLDPATAGFSLVISGHTHQPAVDVRGGVTYLNPGSAGPRRFKLPLSLARLRWDGRRWEIEFVDLGPDAEGGGS